MIIKLVRESAAVVARSIANLGCKSSSRSLHTPVWAKVSYTLEVIEPFISSRQTTRRGRHVQQELVSPSIANSHLWPMSQLHTHTLPLYKCLKAVLSFVIFHQSALQKVKTWKQIFLNKTQNRVIKISLLTIPIVINPYLMFCLPCMRF